MGFGDSESLENLFVTVYKGISAAHGNIFFLNWFRASDGISRILDFEQKNLFRKACQQGLGSRRSRYAGLFLMRSWQFHGTI